MSGSDALLFPEEPVTVTAKLPAGVEDGLLGRTVSTDEHAVRAVLLSRVVSRSGSAEVVRGKFGNPNSLSLRLRELEPKLTVEGREGENELRLAAIDKIASELIPKSSVQNVAKKKSRRKRSGQSLF